MRRLLITTFCFLATAMASATPVRVASENGRFVLLRDGKPFYIKGAVAPNRFDLLRQCGANAVRTKATREALDGAHEAGLAVLVGLPVSGERNGMDWDNEAMLAETKAKVLAVVRELKDHPAVLFWALGNELDYIPVNQPYNPRIWKRLNDLAIAVKEVDPSHPVCTVVGTSFYETKVHEIARDGTAFDLLGINAYGDIDKVAELTRKHLPKPYVITEWGPTGHWEVKKTEWKAPIEQTSSEKAQVIADRYQNVILADRDHCLGSFVFYWSEKQETTHSWYGLFLTGLRTESIDVMEHFWRGEWPSNRAPSIRGLRITGFDTPRAINLKAGESYSAEVTGLDPDGDPLEYYWDVRNEVVIPEKSYAGGGEKPAEPIIGLVRETNTPKPGFKAPKEPGEYRLFVTIKDGKGHIAYGNVPFRVVK